MLEAYAHALRAGFGAGAAADALERCTPPQTFLERDRPASR